MEIGFGKTRVILVEEDSVQRQLIREYLEIGRRYQVSEAEELDSLLELCERPASSEALLMLDFHWVGKGGKGGKGGVKILREIRRRNPSLPILGMLDHRPMPDLQIHAESHGIRLLHKPFSPAQLHRILVSVLKTGLWERFAKILAAGQSRPVEGAGADAGGEALPKTLRELLDMAWQQQAEELSRLSGRELEVLFSELNRLRPPSDCQDVFERFYLAVFSIIRDRREAKG